MNTQTLPQPKTLLSKTLLSKAQLSKTLLPRTAPRAAFGKIVLNEVRLAWRMQAGLIFGIAVPLLLLIIFGEIPHMHQPQASIGGPHPVSRVRPDPHFHGDRHSRARKPACRACLLP